MELWILLQLQINYLDGKRQWRIENVMKWDLSYNKVLLPMEQAKGEFLAMFRGKAEKIFKNTRNMSVAFFQAVRFTASQKDAMMIFGGMSVMECHSF